MAKKRNLSVHPSIIFQTIFSQAGTLSKALLEGIMNAIDAGASQVSIELTRTRFHIIDDGRGFTSKQEIEDWFEVFGTPHEEEKTFGRFRIGRGQLMAYAKTIWSTNRFKMEVDIKNEGLEYHLSEDNSFVEGCMILGELYDTLLPSELDTTLREVADMAKYAQIPVIVNGKQVNTPAAECQWTEDHEHAYIKITSTGGLKIYNQGVFVRLFPGHTFGISGVVVSKQALQLNTARNDILDTQCAIWKQLKKHFRTLSGTKTEKARLNDDDRRYLAFQLRNGEISFYHNTELRLLVDATGKYLPLKRLENAAYQMPITVAPEEGSAMADRIHQRKMAFVLHPKMLDLFEVDNAEELVDLFRMLYENSSTRRLLGFTYLEKADVRPFSEFTEMLDGGYESLPNKDLTLPERLVIKAINDGQYPLLHTINEVLTDRIGRREIKAGLSDVADGWTDGISTIHINRRLLKEAAKGYAGFMSIVALLAHEYLHHESDLGSHMHDSEFYENFHHIMAKQSVDESTAGDSVTRMVTEFCRQLRKNDQKIKQNFLKFEDREAIISTIDFYATA